MPKDVSVSLNWMDRVDLEEVIFGKVTCPQLYNKDYIFYMFHYWAKPLYIGQTRLSSSLGKRIKKHHALPKIAFKYPGRAIKATCAKIDYCNLNRRTKKLVNTIEKVLIYRYRPEFNISAKKNFVFKYRTMKIRNYGDFYPLNKYITYNC
ncbi:MAG: hypothetical protein GF308_16870 [Candidatus Heimdallarchaeota archaeon]|nr:hypothetical protein [Candidatus Heimdallarchaeota archaeon]